ncbi:MAG: hypothetical protein AAGC47_15065 [Bacteroidota bacterium]
MIEIASETDRNTFTNTVIEDATGMTGFWVSNLYFSVHRDMARFGWLALNDFVWDSTAILSDSEYISDLTTPSQNLNPSYGYLWWLNGQPGHMFPLDPTTYEGSMIPSGPDDMYMALGANDQKIYVVPSQSLVVTRQGDAASEMTLAGSTFDEELWSLISNLDCTTLNTRDSAPDRALLFKNPIEGTVDIPDLKELKKVDIFSVSGQFIEAALPGERIYLPRGIYMSRALFTDGRILKEKLVLE